MSIVRWCTIASLLTAVAAQPVSACVYPPPSPQKQGESNADYQKRAESELGDYLANWRRETEAKQLEQASSIYFARIILSEEIEVDGTPYGRRVVVKPLETIRGSLPTSNRELRDRVFTSCGLGGDGWATSGAVSHIAIVFEGEKLRGFGAHMKAFSLLAAEATHPALTEAWGRWKSRANFLYDGGANNK